MRGAWLIGSVSAPINDVKPAKDDMVATAAERLQATLKSGRDREPKQNCNADLGALRINMLFSLCSVCCLQPCICMTAELSVS